MSDVQAPFVPQRPGATERFDPSLWGLAEDEIPPSPGQPPSPAPAPEATTEPEPVVESPAAPEPNTEPETLDQTLTRLFEERAVGSNADETTGTDEGAGGELDPSAAAAGGDEPPPSTQQEVTPPAPAQEYTPVTPPEATQPAPQQPQQVTLEQAAAAFGVAPDQLQAALQVHSDLQGLAVNNPAAIAQLEQILYPSPTPPPTAPGPYNPAAPTPPVPSAPAPYEDEYIDPAIKAAVEPLKQQLDAYGQWAAQQEQQRQWEAQQAQEQQRIQIVQQVNNGRDTFAMNFGLTPEETAELERKVADSGIVAGLYSQYGDGDKAMQAAMAQMYWVTPEFRQREVQRQQAQQAAEDADVTQRARKAGAVAGGSATVTREQQAPTTREGRKAAMISEISGALSGTEDAPT